MSIQCNRTVYCMVGSFFFGGGGAGGKGDDWGKKNGRHHCGTSFEVSLLVTTPNIENYTAHCNVFY